MILQTRLGLPKQRILRKLRRDFFRILPLSARVNRRARSRWSRWRHRIPGWRRVNLLFKRKTRFPVESRRKIQVSTSTKKNRTLNRYISNRKTLQNNYISYSRQFQKKYPKHSSKLLRDLAKLAVRFATKESLKYRYSYHTTRLPPHRLPKFNVVKNKPISLRLVMQQSQSQFRKILERKVKLTGDVEVSFWPTPSSPIAYRITKVQESTSIFYPRREKLGKSHLEQRALLRRKWEKTSN